MKALHHSTHITFGHSASQAAEMNASFFSNVQILYPEGRYSFSDHEETPFPGECIAQCDATANLNIEGHTDGVILVGDEILVSSGYMDVLFPHESISHRKPQQTGRATWRCNGPDSFCGVRVPCGPELAANRCKEPMVGKEACQRVPTQLSVGAQGVAVGNAIGKEAWHAILERVSGRRVSAAVIRDGQLAAPPSQLGGDYDTCEVKYSFEKLPRIWIPDFGPSLTTCAASGQKQSERQKQQENDQSPQEGRTQAHPEANCVGEADPRPSVSDEELMCCLEFAQLLAHRCYHSLLGSDSDRLSGTYTPDMARALPAARPSAVCALSWSARVMPPAVLRSRVAYARTILDEYRAPWVVIVARGGAVPINAPAAASGGRPRKRSRKACACTHPLLQEKADLGAIVGLSQGHTEAASRVWVPVEVVLFMLPNKETVAFVTRGE
eukprot:Rmarinus@m.10989